MSSSFASTSRSGLAAALGSKRSLVSNSAVASPPTPRPMSSLQQGRRGFNTSSMRRQKAEQDGVTAQERMPWDEYLQLRRSRRLAGMVTTVPSMLLAAAGSGSYFLTQELDPTNAIAGIDPVYISVAAVLAFTGFGWLVGPTLGSAFWTMTHSSRMPAIREKDAKFFEHIKKNRVDPSRQSVQNPVPDFYGEKIGSIKQYRQWLRDQAAYRRKAAHGLKDEEV